MATFDRLRYEVKLAGKALIVAPVLALAPAALLVVLDHFLAQSPAHVLLAAVEMLLPIAAGVIAATALASDAALELHLSTPRTFECTSLLRLLLIVVWTSCLSWLTFSIALALQQFELPAFARTASPLVRAALLQLVWLVPLLWLVTAGLAIALLTKSRSASGALLAGIWLLDTIFVGVIAQTAWLRPFLLFPATLLLFPAAGVSRTDFITYWLDTRIELMGMALVLLMLDWLLLRDAEGLLQGVSET